MKTRTNHNWHEFKCRAEVPLKVLTSQFDWMIPKTIQDKPELVKKWHKGIDGPEPELEDNTGDYWNGFIQYQGYWYWSGDFIRMQPDNPLGQEGWDGYHSESMSTGVVLRVSDNFERYQIGSYRE